MEVTPKDASQANELTQAIEAAVSEAGYALSARIQALKMLPLSRAVRKQLPPRLLR